MKIVVSCPDCKSERTRATVTVQLVIDAKDEYTLTRNTIRKPTTILLQQFPQKTVWHCEECGLVWDSRYERGA